MRFGPGAGDSRDIEDRRGKGRGVPASLGIGGFVVLAVLSLIFKENFFALMDGGASGESQLTSSAEEEALRDHVNRVTTDLQNVWERELPRQAKLPYKRSVVVLYRDSTPTACGHGEAATGPFYCPADQKVYLDLSFFAQLSQRFGAPGDAAQAYVIAHEIGHHIQNLTGAERRMRIEARQNPSQKNALSVKLELQADCYAGVWAKSTQERGILEAGDLEEALRCAEAIGDDTLQQKSRGRVRPETFTHGSAAERARWFRRGFDSGLMSVCDTFQ
ncbi:MAG: neutral zinc metallopeptidase [Polyangiaceae bacterium]|nr:neutral zinc metallopeptidase [Polyangiaceae bacterium]